MGPPSGFTHVVLVSDSPLAPTTFSRITRQPAEKIENITRASALSLYRTRVPHDSWDPGRSAAGGLVGEPEAGDDRPRGLVISEMTTQQENYPDYYPDYYQTT